MAEKTVRIVDPELLKIKAIAEVMMNDLTKEQEALSALLDDLLKKKRQLMADIALTRSTFWNAVYKAHRELDPDTPYRMYEDEEGVFIQIYEGPAKITPSNIEATIDSPI